MLFKMNMKLLWEVIWGLRVGCHQYDADDTQFYFSFPPASKGFVKILGCCLEAFRARIRANRLKLNPDKTQWPTQMHQGSRCILLPVLCMPRCREPNLFQKRPVSPKDSLDVCLPSYNPCFWEPQLRGSHYSLHLLSAAWVLFSLLLKLKTDFFNNWTVLVISRASDRLLVECFNYCHIVGLVSTRMIKQPKRIQARASKKRSPAHVLHTNLCMMSCIR